MWREARRAEEKQKKGTRCKVFFYIRSSVAPYQIDIFCYLFVVISCSGESMPMRCGPTLCGLKFNMTKVAHFSSELSHPSTDDISSNIWTQTWSIQELRCPPSEDNKTEDLISPNSKLQVPICQEHAADFKGPFWGVLLKT